MLIKVIKKIILAELGYLKADWWILLFGIGTAILIKVYLGTDKLRAWIKNKERLSVLGSIGFAAFTPLCACGTMAVILSMFASYMPWGPIMAFLVSSPLTSPSQFFFQSGFLGINLAIGVLVSSIILGIGAGALANVLESNTSFFKEQYRIPNQNSCHNDEENFDDGNCCSIAKKEVSCCSEEIKESWHERWKVKEVLKEFYELGIKKVLLYFMFFIAIGQIVEMVVPTELILSLFSGDKIYSIPLAAIVGLPLYISGASALPLLKSILNLGAGEGAVLAFLIAGQGTGVAVITGMSTIIKKRALLFYIMFVLLGAILSGYIYQLIAI